MISHSRLLELLHYDPLTGIFTWKVSRSKGKKETQAGMLRKSGYRHVGIDKKQYYAHRLAWFYIHGVWPSKKIDHIDTIKDHNWISNLQDITNTQNLQRVNTPNKNSTTGYLGVSWHKKRKKFKTQIQIDGKRKHIGLFNTAIEASEAYQAAKLIHHFKEA